MKTILFNTTRQWNPGDEFILQGVQNLLACQHTPIIFNRHPDLKWGVTRDNSFNLKKHLLTNVDYYIAAGTPEWETRGLWPLFDKLIEAQTPCSWLGIGQAPRVQERLAHLFLNQTDVIACRDRGALGACRKYNPTLLPCPAFFASEVNKSRTMLKRLGVIYMTSRTGANRISEADAAALRELISDLLREHPNLVIVCHYLDEFLEAKSLWPEQEIRYSYDSRDYPDFFLDLDLVVGHRLHGVILAASTGAPGILLAGSDDSGRRKGGIEPFELPVVSEWDMLKTRITQFPIKSESDRLLQLKIDTYQKYRTLLEPFDL